LWFGWSVFCHQTCLAYLMAVTLAASWLPLPFGEPKLKL
jgi:hypothetical protein